MFNEIMRFIFTSFEALKLIKAKRYKLKNTTDRSSKSTYQLRTEFENEKENLQNEIDRLNEQLRIQRLSFDF